MRFAIALLVIGPLIAQLPPITIQSIAGSGVYLVAPDSPHFKQAVANEPPMFEYIRQLTALHPYAVAMSNQSDKEIWAYSVRWSGKDADGEMFSSIGLNPVSVPGSPMG